MLAQGRLLFFNTVTSYVKSASSLLVSLVLTPFILNHIGTEAYGLWALLFSVLGFFTLLDLGFATATVKYVAEMSGKGSIFLRNQIISTTAVAYFILAGISAGATAVLAYYFSSWFSIPAGFQQALVPLIWVLSLRTVILNLPLSLFRGVLFGEQRIYLVNLSAILSNIVYACLVYTVLNQGYGLVALAYSSLAAMLLEHMLYIVMAFLTVERLRISLALVDMKVLKKVASFSGFQLITDISSLVFMQVDLILIQYFLGLELVAIYSIALKISTHIFYLSKQFVNTLSPLIARYHGEERRSAIHEVLIKGTRIALVPGVIFSLCLYVFGDRAIEFWVGENFSLSAKVLSILMLVVLLCLPCLVAANVLAMTEFYRFSSLISIVSVLMNIFLSILLVKPLGIMGIAWGSVLSRFFVDCLFGITKACKEYTVSVQDYLLSGIFPALLPGIFMYALLVGFKEHSPPQNLFWLFIDCALAAAVYCALFWRYSLEDEIKSKFHNFLYRT